MKLTVLLFASYADAFGAPSLEVELPAGAQVRQLLERVRQLAAARSLPPALVAVNQEYASLERPLAPSDEVALIPPVAGG